MYSIIFNELYGRGLYANQDINRNILITRCELLKLSERDTRLLEQTSLRFYKFKLNNTCDCIVLGDGSLFNHDEKANVYYQLAQHDDRTVMNFYSNRFIDTGEQLFINYNADVKVNIKEYIGGSNL